MKRRERARRFIAGVVAPALAGLMLSACNDDGATAPGPTYAVGGIVSGTDIASLKLTNNGGDEVSLNAAGRFSFPGRLPDGAAYDVRISQQPGSPAQTCTVSSNAGTVSGADVTDVYVECSPLSLSILQISDTGPGQQPTVTFKVRLNGAPADILATPLQALRATIAGPTTDYGTASLATLQGVGASGVLEAVDATQGVFRYTFPASLSIPMVATGSYALGLEGYVLDTGAPGARITGVSPVMPFRVTDAATVPRRTVVEDARCNACHGALTAHGNRRGVQYCATCHNANAVNLTNVARLEGQSIEVPSVDMKVMIHKIHRGSGLVRKPYLLWAYPGPTVANPAATPLDFSAISFPGDLGACENCHRPGTYDVPLAQDRLPTMAYTYACNEDPAADTDSLCAIPSFVATATKQTPAVTASCLSCHDAPHTESHAATMTTTTGAESCATCHAIGSTFGIDRYHSMKVRSP